MTKDVPDDNATDYKIGDMKYGQCVGGAIVGHCVGFAIVLRAMKVPFGKAQKILLQDYKNKKIAMRAFIKVIKIKNLSSNFSEAEYENKDFVEHLRCEKTVSQSSDSDRLISVLQLDPGHMNQLESFLGQSKGSMSDYQRIKALAKLLDDTFTEAEMHAVERMIKICLNNDLIRESKILSVKYTADHIRYICRRKVGAIDRANIDDVSSGDYELNGSEIDHIVEYQIIYRVCRECDYNITMAVGFALHFNKDYNLRIIDANENTKKRDEVTQYLKVNEDCGELVEEIKTRYRETIRGSVLESIKESQETCDKYCDIYCKDCKAKKDAELNDVYSDYIRLGKKINANKRMYNDAIIKMDKLMERKQFVDED